MSQSRLDILAAGFSAIMDAEMVTPQKAASLGLKLPKISVQSLFEHTYVQMFTVSQLMTSQPMSPPFYVNVKTSIGWMFKVLVKKSQTIGDVKTLIEYQEPSLMKYKQRELTFNEKEVADNEIVENIGMSSGDTVFLTLKGDFDLSTTAPVVSPPFYVTVKTSLGWIFKVLVKKNMTISDVKALIESEDPSLPEQRQRITFNGRELADDESIEKIGISSGDAIFLSLMQSQQLIQNGSGEGPVFELDVDTLDSSCDFDFTSLRDDGKQYIRGGQVYNRPYGWYRYAIKVNGNKAWLGKNDDHAKSSAGEWPVSYHGTKATENVKAIIALKGYETTGERRLVGPGIYSSPYVQVAENYARVFTYAGKTYKVILQNRINPDHLQVVSDGLYWISPMHEPQHGVGYVRPYGILIKEIKRNNYSSSTSKCSLQ